MIVLENRGREKRACGMFFVSLEASAEERVSGAFNYFKIT